MKDINELVLIKVFAEGCYSGSTETCAVVVDKAFHEEWEDSYGTVYFHELDGKHSETVGNVTFTEVTEQNIQDVIRELYEADSDEYYIWEQMMDGVWEEADVQSQVDLNNEFWKRCKVEVVTKVYLDGEEL